MRAVFRAFAARHSTEFECVQNAMQAARGVQAFHGVAILEFAQVATGAKIIAAAERRRTAALTCDGGRAKLRLVIETANEMCGER